MIQKMKFENKVFGFGEIKDFAQCVFKNCEFKLELEDANFKSCNFRKCSFYSTDEVSKIHFKRCTLKDETFFGLLRRVTFFECFDRTAKKRLHNV